MEITNKECREIAKELRKLADSPYSSDDVRSDVRIEDVCYELGLERGFHDDCVDPESVKHLADLIDRPKCKKEEHDEHYWRCTRCGGFICWDAVTDCCGVIPTRYCPWCGAEVVE